MSHIVYQVAGHQFSVSLKDNDLLLESLSAYEPFRVQTSHAELFRLTVDESDYHPTDFVEKYSQSDEGQRITYGQFSDGSKGFLFQSNQENAGWLSVNSDYSEATLYTIGEHRKLAFDNSMMILFALSTANLQTALFHASVVSRNGYGYLFLGKSGTGKSTHSQLWLKHLEGTELVNDDNPVVRIVDGETRVYGSPWSGKTPCYRNVDYPVGGIVFLAQAPYNRIQRLPNLVAYASLLSSISGMRWDKQIADGLHEMEKSLVGKVPMWHLECLPDEEAARVCSGNIEIG